MLHLTLQKTLISLSLTCVSGSQDLIIRLLPHAAALDGSHAL